MEQGARWQWGGGSEACSNLTTPTFENSVRTSRNRKRYDALVSSPMSTPLVLRVPWAYMFVYNRKRDS